MPTYFIPVLTFFLGVVLAMLLSQRTTDRAAERQRHIAYRGKPAQGRIMKVWQPPLAGSFARIYFEYEPEGEPRRVRCVHIDRRPKAMSASLPPPGTLVKIHYLPDDPAKAVIAKLVSRFG